LADFPVLCLEQQLLDDRDELPLTEQVLSSVPPNVTLDCGRGASSCTQQQQHQPEAVRQHNPPPRWLFITVTPARG